MKKFTDIEEYPYYNIVLYIMAIVLVLISFSIMINSLGFNIYDQNQIDSNKDQISVILAFSTIVLVLITINYAKSTKKLLDEQVKLRKLNYSKDILENVYSPLNNALNKFRWNAESLPIDRIPQNYNREFEALYDDILKINNKYNHLINQKIKNRFQEVWNSWRQYLHDPILANYNILNDYINLFNAEITEHFNLEKNLFNNLQQLGENMNSEDESKKLDKLKTDFLKAVDEIDKVFLKNITDKNELKYIKKLAEIEISKKEFKISHTFTEVGLILAFLAIGISEILFGISLKKNITAEWSQYYLYGGLGIIILGILYIIWSRLQMKNPKKQIEYMYDIILNVENSLNRI